MFFSFNLNFFIRGKEEELKGRERERNTCEGTSVCVCVCVCVCDSYHGEHVYAFTNVVACL